jgi:hypothetical protein
VPAANPAAVTPTLVVEGAFKLTVPVAGVAVSHFPPAGVVTVVAVQVSAFTQVPLAVMVAACATGFGCPVTPRKVRAGVAVVIAQGACTACTTKLTGINSGLPAARWPRLSVPVIVMVAV